MLAQVIDQSATLKGSPITWGDALIALSVLTATGGAVWRIGVLFNRIDKKMDHIDGRVGDLEEDSFGVSKACELALRGAILNPGMRVPDPRDPSQVITVSLEDQR